MSWPVIRRSLSCALLVGLFVVTACSRTDAPRRAATVGAEVPVWSGELLDGGTFDTRDSAPVTLINLWATWCPPCRAEMPFLEQLHREFGPRGLRVVGISSDARSAREAVERFVADGQLSFAIALDPLGSSLDQFGVLGLPATFVVDSEGVVRLIRRGPVDAGDAGLLSTLESLLEAL